MMCPHCGKAAHPRLFIDEEGRRNTKCTTCYGILPAAPKSLQDVADAINNGALPGVKGQAWAKDGLVVISPCVPAESPTPASCRRCGVATHALLGAMPKQCPTCGEALHQPNPAAMLGEALQSVYRAKHQASAGISDDAKMEEVETAARALEAVLLRLQREAENEAIRRAFAAQVDRMEAFSAKVERVLESAVEEACNGGSADRRGVDGPGIPAGDCRGVVALGEGQAVAPETCWTTIIGAPTHRLGELPEKCLTCAAKRAEDRAKGQE